MVKKILLLAVLIIAVNTANSKGKYPNSIVNLGIGAGPNYGILGLKTVIGFKNNGLMFSAGTLERELFYTVGVQGSYKWLYYNFGYGSYGIARSYDDKELIKGFIVSTGGMINIGRVKRMFIDLGVSFCTSSNGQYGQNLLFNIGYGFRLGKY